jgi:VCBS repeat-containing protein
VSIKKPHKQADIDIDSKDSEDSTFPSIALVLPSSEINTAVNMELQSIDSINSTITIPSVLAPDLPLFDTVVEELYNYIELSLDKNFKAEVGVESSSNGGFNNQNAVIEILHYIDSVNSVPRMLNVTSEPVGVPIGALIVNTTANLSNEFVNHSPVSLSDSGFTTESAKLFVPSSGILSNDYDPDGGLLVVGAVNGSSENIGKAFALGGGLCIVNIDGSYSFDPDGHYESLALGQTAVESFVYQSKDPYGALGNPTLVTIAIIGENDPPAANNDVGITDEHNVINIPELGLLFNDSDVDNGTVLSVSKVNGSAANVGNTLTLASGALLTVNADGSYSFDPNGKYESLAQGQTATAIFTYQPMDEQGALSATVATVTITINGVNDAPIANNDVGGTTNENTILNVAAGGILTNDTDVDTGATKTVGTVNGLAVNVGVPIAIGAGGLLTVNANGSYSFNPNGKYASLAVGQTATENFSYQAKDEFGALSNVAMVKLTITGVNNVPAAVADTGVTDEHTILTVAKAGLLLNDIDPDNGAVLSITKVNGLATNVGKALTLASGALLTVNADGSYSFNPNGKYESLAQGKSTTATFTYQAIDDKGALSVASPTVTITINGVNDAPVANNDVGTTKENTILNVAAGGILTNDTDVDTGATRTVGIVNGLAANVGVPIAIGAGGLLTVNANGSYSFNPNGKYASLAVGQSATETFSYQAKDQFGVLSNVATVKLTITGVNNAPVAVADTGVTDEHTVLTVAKAGLLLNDTDVDNGAILSVGRVNGVAANVGKAISIGAGALLKVNADGSYSFDPNGKYESLAQGKSSKVSFTYQAVDTQGALSAAATVTLTINGVNDAPIAVNDVRTISENTKLSVAAAGVLSNDTDVDAGATRTVGEVNGTGSIGSQITLASGALLTLNSNGSYVYNPNGKFNYLAAGVNGTDSFTYKALDDKGALSNLATVTLTITGVNNAPVAVNDMGSTTENAKLVAPTGTLLLNDYDVDIGNTILISTINAVAGNVGKQIALASGALLTVNADGGYTYDPNGKFNYLTPGQIGTDSFNYQIKDNVGASSGTAKVTIQIVGTLPPVVFDLNGDNHIDLLSVQNSNARFDLNGSGHTEKIAWVGPNDGILVYDYQQDGKVTNLNEISFTSYLSGATTDLEGLKAFDANQNNQLDPGDANWDLFNIWQDKNGNGIVELNEMSDLSSHEVVSLSLVSDNQAQMIEGSLVTGYAKYETANGESHIAADVKLAVEPYPAQTLQVSDVVSQPNPSDIATLVESLPLASPDAAPVVPPAASSVVEPNAAAPAAVSMNVADNASIQHALDVPEHLKVA